MPVIRKEMKTMREDYMCDKCGSGHCRSTGFTLTSNPPQYPHRCDACGDEQTFRVTYPRTVFVTDAELNLACDPLHSQLQLERPRCEPQ